MTFHDFFFKFYTLRRKPSLSMVSHLVQSFESMHLGVEHKDRDHCEKLLQSKLKKWTKSGRIPNRPTTIRKKSKYVMKIFNHPPKVQVLFEHEVEVLQSLKKSRSTFGPKVHEAFVCGPYGLIVMDNWQGTVLDLVFSNNAHNSLDELHEQAKQLLTKLHKAGWTFVRNRLDFRSLVYRHHHSRGVQLGLVNWKHAKRVTEAGKLHDFEALQFLFKEIQTAKENPTSPILPHSMTAALRKKKI